VLGYFLLTGLEIFDGQTIAELCRKHLNETPMPPSRRTGKVFDPQFESLLMRCLEKDPAIRPQSTSALAQQLIACASVKSWTLEQRAAWWSAYRKSNAGIARPKPLRFSQVDKTVKIEFADRTP
jgi:serine/threonine protein kinase